MKNLMRVLKIPEKNAKDNKRQESAAAPATEPKPTAQDNSGLGFLEGCQNGFCEGFQGFFNYQDSFNGS